MKFNEFQYKRPNMEVFRDGFNQLLEQMKQASSVEEQMNGMSEIIELRTEFESMMRLVSTRHTIDTTDEFYKQEQDYFDEWRPVYQGLIHNYYEVIIHSSFRKELEKKWGKQLFNIAEANLKTFSEDVVDDLKQENKLVSEYVKLLAAAKIDFEGEERNLAQLGPFLLSPNRETRKKAHEAKYAYFAENESKIDEIYDQLVKVRTKIAKKLGYKNFVELGYARMNRTDYGPTEVEAFRNQVHDHIVPVATKLKERQQSRIGVETLQYYDDNFNFKTGNPEPKGGPEWIVEQGKKMYEELSPETNEFIHFMIDNELMDLVSKKGKAGGGYCTYIKKYKAPFIFSNFNGTAGDVRVLKHEAGHALQVYLSRGFEVPEYALPTFEAAEIHSMSMEFFTWPWMELFFEEDTEKYKFSHLSGALQFIPYGVSVDEFQHFVYENPDATPEERKQAWREIEKKYLPHRNYEENEYLDHGGFWHQQAHIFKMPFYYIDYTLAQICAFQFWKKSNENHDKAWEDYINLCSKGGSLPFTQLVDEANIISPFKVGCVESVIGEIENWLNGVDDTAL